MSHHSETETQRALSPRHTVTKHWDFRILAKWQKTEVENPIVTKGSMAREGCILTILEGIKCRIPRNRELESGLWVLAKVP